MPTYGVSFQGKRHLQKGVPCQDCCGYTTTPNNWIVAVVADGVSASPNSEVGAAIAVNSCLEYFSGLKYSPFFDADGIQLVIRDAFNYALRCIKESDKPGEYVPFSKMTTLQVLIFHKKIGLHWGQAGDGALIIRNTKGNWKRVTYAMKNEEDNDSPIILQDGPAAWQFGSLSVQELDSILLTTDGVADIIGDENTDKEVGNAVVSFLMTPPNADLNKQETDSYYRDLFFETVDKAHLYDDKATNTAIAQLSSITDDITILLVNGLCSLENDDINELKNSSVKQHDENPETKLRERHGSVDDKYQQLNTSSVQTNLNQFDQGHNSRRKSNALPRTSGGQAGYKSATRRIPNLYNYSESHGKSSLVDIVLKKLFANKIRFLIILPVIIVLVLVANLLLRKTPIEHIANPQETDVESEMNTSPLEIVTPFSDDQLLINDGPHTTISSKPLVVQEN